MRTLVLLLLLSCFSLPRLASAEQIEVLTLRFDHDALALRSTGAPPDHD